MTSQEMHVAAYEVLIEAREFEAAEVLIDTATDEELLMMLDIIVE